MMARIYLRLALAGAAALAATTAAAPAYAGTGCNGVVNIFVWGCAPWDNNNGPRFPYYKKRQISVPAKDAQVVERNGVKMVLYNGNYYPLVGTDGASLIGNAGGTLKVWSQ